MLFSMLYNMPLAILGAFWLFSRTQEVARFQILRALLDIAIISVGIARFYGSSIPPSGHAVFLTHSIITVSNPYYRIAALMMLIMTIGLKISWGDYRSWSYGVVIGVISGTAWVRTGKKSDGEIRTS